MRALRALLWKDALIELRSAERLPVLALFSVAILLTLHFTLPPTSEARTPAAPGFLWAAIVFAALLELRSSLESERRDGTLDGLRLAPVDPTAIYIGKVASSVAVLAVLEAALVPLVALFFTGRASGVAPAIGVAVAGTVGLVAWGTLFAAVVGGTRAGEVILPVLLFPLIVPQTIACVRLLAMYLTGAPLDDPATAFVLLAAFDVLSLGTSILLFDHVLDA